MPKPSKSTNLRTLLHDTVKIFAFLNQTFQIYKSTLLFEGPITEFRSDETQTIQIYKSTDDFSWHYQNFCFQTSKNSKSTNQHIFLKVHILRPELTQIIQIYKSTVIFLRAYQNFCFPESKVSKSTNLRFFLKVLTLKSDQIKPKPSKSTNLRTLFRDTIKIFAFLNPNIPNLQIYASFWRSKHWSQSRLNPNHPNLKNPNFCKTFFLH